MAILGIKIEGGIDIGGGITIGEGAATSFTLSSSDFTYFSAGYNVTGASNTGYQVTGVTGPGQSVFQANLSVSSGGNLTKQTELVNFWNNQGWSLTDGASRIFDVTWGPSSSPSTGKVVLALFWYDINNCYFNIGTVYTGDNNWQTPGQNIYNGVTLANELGTFNFPATFTLYTPVITDGDQWC
jgi:hypothetical protein